MLLAALTTLALQASPPVESVLREVEPDSVGVDAGKLAVAAELIEQAVRDDILRGAVILVARRGGIVLHEAYGWRDEAREVPMQRDTLFRMASNTKPVVAAAVLQLVDENKLDLNDPVGAYIPSFAEGRSAGIRVTHLLAHTSGLRIAPIFLTPLLQGAETPGALQREAARFGSIGPKEEPGKTYQYSNPGYNTLGALVEVLREAPLEDVLRERIYEPLGMKDSCNHESVADRERMSCVFQKLKSGKWRTRWRPTDPPDYPFVRASGGMITTAQDYARFLQAMLQGGEYGGERILAESLVREAFKRQNEACFTPEEARTREFFYGLGWSVRKDGAVAHSGSDGTFAWIDPKRELIGMVLTQSATEQNPRVEFTRLVEAACLD